MLGSLRKAMLLVGTAAIGLFVFSAFKTPVAQATINNEINFQGKLTNPDGTNVTNNTYTIVFSLYTVSSGGSNVWTESQSVVVTDGVFRVSLGSITPLPGSVDFNTASLYLGVKVGADTEMTPRVRFTASPYAFNSDKLNGIASTGYVQLAQGVQADASTTNPSIFINKTGATARILDLQRTASTVFAVNNDGGQTISPTAGADITTSLLAGSQVLINATAVPTADMVSISNVGQAVTTASVNGLAINYVGGAAAVESGALRIDLTPGTTSGGTWNGLRIVANATGAVSGVTAYGIKLEGPTSPGAGTEVGMLINANWDSGLQIGSKSTDPTSTPAASNIYLYARNISGRSMLRQKGPSGVSFAYQPALFEQAISFVGPNTTTTASSFGSAWTIDTTLSHPAATQAFGYAMNYATAAAGGDTAGIYQTTAQWFRGNAAGSNGFFNVSRIGTPDASYGAGGTGTRIWAGMSDQTGAVMTNNDNPAGNYAAFQYSTNRGDTNWQFLTKNNTTQSVVNTGMAFAVTKVYDMYVYCAPQGTTIYWRIDNLTDGTTFEGNTATNLPINTTALRAGSSIQTLTGTARNLRVMKIYVEADK